MEGDEGKRESTFILRIIFFMGSPTLAGKVFALRTTRIWKWSSLSQCSNLSNSVSASWVSCSLNTRRGEQIHFSNLFRASGKEEVGMTFFLRSCLSFLVASRSFIWFFIAIRPPSVFLSPTSKTSCFISSQIGSVSSRSISSTSSRMTCIWSSLPRIRLCREKKKSQF